YHPFQGPSPRDRQRVFDDLRPQNLPTKAVPDWRILLAASFAYSLTTSAVYSATPLKNCTINTASLFGRAIPAALPLLTIDYSITCNGSSPNNPINLRIDSFHIDQITVAAINAMPDLVTTTCNNQAINAFFIWNASFYVYSNAIH